ncbi:MAG: hypothetical protein EXS60_00935 [Candidatus Pacebacteria bacterium]|nr:hypothetical protein [Candidatus Paceibacterota bacterium]
MYAFLLQLTLIAGLAVMTFIVLRSLPRVTVEEGETEPSLAARFGNFLNSLPLHHVDERINGFLFKLLKRSRVFILKLDNRLSRHLDRVKKSGEQAAASSVQEMIDHVQGEKGE